MFSLKRIFRLRQQSLTPLLMSRRDMERTIRKERCRCDRHQLTFGLICIQFYSHGPQYRSEVKELAKILHRRLRVTDEKGELSAGRIGILLPHTDRSGAAQVLDEIGDLAAKKEIYFKAEILTYPNSTGSDHLQPNDRSDSNRRIDVLTTARSVGKSDDFPIEDTYLAVVGKSYPAWKRAMDIVGATAGLIVSSPILVVAAVAIKMNSPGPVLFCQERTGYLGRHFKILKLRTMVVGADQQQSALLESNERDGPAFKMKDDPRVTTVGRFLRAVGIDELPQLWNVLVGDMAIVGPRPLPCHEDRACRFWQRRRLDSKPGITCTWQVAKSREILFEDWMRMDLNYSDRIHFLRDIKLILKTIWAVVRGRVEH